MCQNNCGESKRWNCKSWGLLALRIALGIIFIYNGYFKLGPGHEMVAGMMAKFVGPASMGQFWAYFVGGLELVGGIMLVLGLFTCYAAGWLSVILVIAMLTVHRGGPFNGYFLPLAALGGTLALMGTGAGKFSVLKKKCCGGQCANKDASATKDGCACGGNCGCGKAEMTAEENKK